MVATIKEVTEMIHGRRKSGKAAATNLRWPMRRSWDEVKVEEKREREREIERESIKLRRVPKQNKRERSTRFEREEKLFWKRWSKQRGNVIILSGRFVFFLQRFPIERGKRSSERRRDSRIVRRRVCIRSRRCFSGRTTRHRPRWPRRISFRHFLHAST